MATQLEENVSSDFSEKIPPVTSEMDSNEISSQKHIHLTAESELIDDDKQGDIKTIDSQDNDITEDEQANTKRSRELKLLLALSKEANLDLNISHKRKSLDTIKLKEIATTSTKLSSENDPVVKKLRIDKFPITAESEIESMDTSSVLEASITDKGKKEESVAIEERKHIKDVKIFKVCYL